MSDSFRGGCFIPIVDRTSSVALAALLVMLLVPPVVVYAQTDAVATDELPEPQYPIAVAATAETLYVVDLNLPGVWAVQGGQRDIFVQGSHLLRSPLNRPRCIAIHPDDGILVGDSATREIYHVAGSGAEPQPLTGASVGIPMSLAVSPDGTTIYVGDAEKRAVLSVPLAGGTPELVARVNARGLAFDGDGTLWAVTPDDAAVHRIDVNAGTSEPVITGRPYLYPNGLAWAGDFGLVSDGYGQSVWKFTGDGATEPYLQGTPLKGPVGITADDQSIWIADPKQRQVFQVDRETKQAVTRL